MPTGEYRSDRLINLGANRWVIRPEIGVLHQRRQWQFELTGSVFIFGDNDEFWRGTDREQEPLWFAQCHAIYTFRPGLWASLSGGYAWHRIELRRDFDPVALELVATNEVAEGQHTNASLAFASGRTNTLFDSNLDNVSAGWSLMF